MSTHSSAIIESLKSAPLLANDLPQASAFDRSLFNNVDVTAELNFDQKLGHLYEQALEILIKATPSLELLGSHVQVFDGDNRTIGELDFILFERALNRHIHLELAVKFYLAHEGKNGWRYPGPNATDNWHKKLNRMQAHQLMLSHRSETQKLLSSRFGITKIDVQHLIYGCLFTPIDTDELLEPNHMAGDGQTGQWLYAKQWQDALKDDVEILLLPKPLWPVMLTAENKKLLEVLSKEKLLELAHNHCVMFAFKNSETKYFMVPDQWPSH